MTGSQVRALLSDLAATFERERAELGSLDAAIGDGDHGVGMARGFTQAATAAAAVPGEDAAPVFQAAGLALMSHIGGASGPLFATIFLELGKAFAEASAPPAESFASGLERAARQIQRLGRAAPGDKTLLDALLPAAEAARNATESLDRAQAAAAEAARDGAEASAGMEARRGRARFIEGSGVGHPDPGAVSVALILESWRGER
ncbi:MAG: dihydroxyacetone kinase subunit DhaL [Truepera sp.]|nr:dihydroxyacetone kinase subunit DhaL [Truepera sp.]